MGVDCVLICFVFRPYKCEFCDVRYYRKYQLVKHIDTKHAGMRSQKISTPTIHSVPLSPLEDQD